MTLGNRRPPLLKIVRNACIPVGGKHLRLPVIDRAFLKGAGVIQLRRLQRLVQSVAVVLANDAALRKLGQFLLVNLLHVVDVLWAANRL